MKTYCIVFYKDVDYDLIESYGGVIVDKVESIPSLVIVSMDENTKLLLEKHDSIKMVEEDSIEETDSYISLPTKSVGESYANSHLNVREFWKRGFRGQGIKVAIMDTGSIDHSNLDIRGGINAYDTSKSYLLDNGGHGTHVAGIVAGKGIEGGYLGIAPEVELYIIKTDNDVDSGIITSAQVVGMNWAIENNMDIVNCSFGGITDNPSLSRNLAFQAAYDNGILIVCSSGNHGSTDLEANDTDRYYPASLPSTIGIGNLTNLGKKNPSSATGEAVEFSCYGTSYASSTNDGLYGRKSGTSMSSPCFAGMMALYKSAYPELDTLEKLMNKVKESVIKVWDDDRVWTRAFGYGIPGIPEDLLLKPIVSHNKERSIKILETSGDKTPISNVSY